jgi:hypothetical protein
MSAVVMSDATLAAAAQWLVELRSDLGRQPGDTLHWRNFKSHTNRLCAAKSLGEQTWTTVSTVVVCKRHLAGSLTDDQAYLYTFRYLLERLSWLARDRNSELSYTLAHIIRFKIAQLRSYEATLRRMAAQGTCNIEWAYLDPAGGSLDQPSRVELLQAADLAASATFAAFEPDRHGFTEPRYLQLLGPRLYRRGTGANRLTSYGLKIHPWADSTKAAYPWVAAL